HLLCDNTSPAGCMCCKPKSTRLCCDLCNPHDFDNIMISTSLKPARASAKSSVKPYQMLPSDHNLQCAILDWQQQKMISRFGPILL
ncbi:hypothetical protein L208DRAFT_1299808, partial [Tricholoma matsutake]